MPAVMDHWRALARRFPWTMRFAWGLAVLILAGDVWIVARRVHYARETSRLRAAMSAVELARIDAAMQSDSNRLQVIIELARRQARGDAGLHLAVPVDSGLVSLEQEGATLRTIPAEVAPDQWVRSGTRDSLRVSAPRGARTIESVLGDSVVVLSGGSMIYARAAGDPASGSVRPGCVRVGAADLRAIRPSLREGQRVYFY